MEALLEARPGPAAEAQELALDELARRSPWTARLLRWSGERTRAELVPVLAWLFLAEELPLAAQDFEGRRAASELEHALDPERAGASPLGRALAGTPPAAREALRGHLAGLREDAETRTVATFEELAARAVRRGRPAADALLAALEHGAGIDERRRPRLEIRLRATAAALVRVRWLADAGRDWRLAGVLRLPVDALHRGGVELTALARPEEAAGLDAVVREAALRAADELGKAWPLCRELGLWRGRLAAILLRRTTRMLLRVYRRPLAPFGPEPLRLGRLASWRAALAGLLTRRPPRALASAVRRYSSR